MQKAVRFSPDSFFYAANQKNTENESAKHYQHCEKYLKPGKSPLVPYRHDTDVYTYTYTPVDNTENETRTWDDKMYYRAISRDEINRNDKLVNNPGF